MTEFVRKAIDSRKSLRYPTLFPGVVQNGVARLSVMIDDLSEEGGHIRLDHILPIGSRLVLTADSLNVPAVIVRVTPRGYGLRLFACINPLAVVRANITCWWKRDGRADADRDDAYTDRVASSSRSRD